MSEKKQKPEVEQKLIRWDIVAVTLLRDERPFGRNVTRGANYELADHERGVLVLDRNDPDNAIVIPWANCALIHVRAVRVAVRAAK